MIVQVIGWVGMLAGCCLLAALMVLANHGELRESFDAIGRRLLRFLGPSGCYIQPSIEKITPVKSEPTGLFLIDERCPGCLGTGRLRVNILEDDADEERMWRELELQATLKDSWQVARTCTGCGMPFATHKDVDLNWCSLECQKAYYDRGKRTLCKPVDLDITTHGDGEHRTIKGWVTDN